MSTRTEAASSTPAGRPTSGYIPAIDGLRAVAVVLVLVHHFITPIHFGGAIGVDIFFVISGQLITSILLREYAKRGGINLRRFYMRRIVRLYPALLVVVAALIIPGLIFASSWKWFMVETFFALTYTTPIALEVSNGVSAMWRHTWSLGIEEMFYLVWPLLLVLAVKRGKPDLRLAALTGTGGAILLAGYLVGEIITGERGSLLLRSGGLLIGCAVALVLWNRPAFRVGPAAAWLSLALIGVAVIFETVTELLGVAVLITCLASAILIAHLVTAPRSTVSRSLSVGPAVYLGTISYELYLWHYPILVLFAWATGMVFYETAWVAAPLSLIAAAGTHRLLAPAVDKLKARF